MWLCKTKMFPSNMADLSDDVNLIVAELLFHDAVKEGNEDWHRWCWKFHLVLFKSTSHLNSTKEAVNLLFEYRMHSQRE